MKYSEHGLVPFDAVPLAGERLLVLAPHPDDEVIGCGGLIALHALERRSVRTLVLSDGAEAADPATRQRETIEGLRLLGAPEPRFVGIPDRQLADRPEDLAAILREEIVGFRPDLIACPAPTEIHPDHVAVARALVDLLQSDFALIAETAIARVAFYEVSQPIRPNTLVDITRVADQKFLAVRAHASQVALHDYDAYARGLNRYRTMSLAREVRYAEAYWVAPLSSLHTTGWSDLRDQLGPSREVQVISEPIPITVVVRTKDRPALLEEALASISANDYPAEVVVVNDGGVSPAPLVRSNPNALLIEHSTPRGRSDAMNAGVRAAATPFIAFLDDDDRFYPDHLRTLAQGMSATRAGACYTDALSVFMEIDASGTYQPVKRLRLFAQPFDRELLLLDNYIPLPTLLLAKDDYFRAGGFDPQMDLFEDWDFLIRLSRERDFVRIPRLTCEIRHFASSGSIIVGTPEASEGFRQAKLEIWRRHFTPGDPHVIANVFERQKKALAEQYSFATEERGRSRHLENDIARLMREKDILLEQLQEQTAARYSAEADRSQLQAESEGLHRQVDDATAEIARFSADLDQITAGFHDRDETIQKLHAEIERLNAMLEAIYQSRTWKLHQSIDKLRGKA